jgi:hypothetical protein
MQNVVFKFRRPSGSNPQQPSRALTEALHRIGEAEEMQSLLAQARQSGKYVAIEVFQTRGGQPLLIHFTKESALKIYDSSGNLVSDMAHSRTADGRSITTNTQYNTYNGRPTNQNVTVCETNGKVITTNIININGKLLP